MPQTNRSRTSSGKMRPTNIVHQHPPPLHSSPPILHPSSSPLLVELASSAKDISNPLPDHSSLSQSAGKVSNPSCPSPNAHPKVQWCADSGASSHMTPHRNWFEHYEPWIVPVRVANGTLLKSAGIGSVSFTGSSIKCLHDDKEGGLSSNAFNAQPRSFGIQRRFTMRAEPHSNGVAECAIRSIAD